MGFFQDFKKYLGDWSSCKSNTLRRTIYLRPAQDATREDLLITHDQQSDIERALSSMNIKKQLEKAIYLSRAHGTAYVVFLDNPDHNGIIRADKHLNEFSRSIAVRKTLDVDRDGLYSLSINGKPLSVHNSRVFRIEGDYDENLKPVKATHFVENEIDILWDIIRSTLAILKKSSVHAMKIEGLDQLLAEAALDDELSAQVKGSLDSLAKAINNDSAIFMDTSSSLDAVSFSLNGINDICNELRGMIAGATLPELVLFDKSPQGLSSSRREQLEHYYSYIKSIQETQLSQIYDAVFKYVLIEFEDVNYDFKPLDVMSNKEKAEIRAMNIAVADNIIHNLNLSTEDAFTVYKSLDIIDELDIDIKPVELYSNPYEEDYTDTEQID